MCRFLQYLIIYTNNKTNKLRRWTQQEEANDGKQQKKKRKITGREKCKVGDGLEEEKITNWIGCCDRETRIPALCNIPYSNPIPIPRENEKRREKREEKERGANGAVRVFSFFLF